VKPCNKNELLLTQKKCQASSTGITNDLTSKINVILNMCYYSATSPSIHAQGKSMIWKMVSLYQCFSFAIFWFSLLLFSFTITALIVTPQANVQSCPTYLGKLSMTCTSERSYLSVLRHHSPVTPNTINFNTQCTVSEVHSDTYIRNLLPSIQSLSGGEKFTSSYNFWGEIITYALVALFIC
jgi:hypothetical protein